MMRVEIDSEGVGTKTGVVRKEIVWKLPVEVVCVQGRNRICVNGRRERKIVVCDREEIQKHYFERSRKEFVSVGPKRGNKLLVLTRGA